MKSLLIISARIAPYILTRFPSCRASATHRFGMPLLYFKRSFLVPRNPSSLRPDADHRSADNSDHDYNDNGDQRLSPPGLLPLLFS